MGDGGCQGWPERRIAFRRGKMRAAEVRGGADGRDWGGVTGEIGGEGEDRPDGFPSRVGLRRGGEVILEREFGQGRGDGRLREEREAEISRFARSRFSAVAFPQEER